MRYTLWVGLVILVVSLAGCGDSGTGDAPPPTVADLETLPTAIFLTDNAPPAGFSTFQADPIDANLAARQGWAYTVTGSFAGTFDDDGTDAAGEFEARVQANEIGATRRVVLRVSGPAFLSEDALLQLEGVRWSNDYYLVDVNGRCTQGPDGAAIADLGAGQLIGGVVRAVPTGHRAAVAGIPAWQYTFELGDIRLPTTTLHLDPSAGIAVEADLWIGPELDAVLVYELTAVVSGAQLFSAQRSVSGSLFLRYELDIEQFDMPQNISIPNGC